MTNAGPGKRHAVTFHDEPIDLMHVGDAARALVETLRHEGALEPVYNVNGFTARMSEIARAAERAVPGCAVELAPVPPALTFPLIDDGRFRAALGFAPEYGLEDVVAAMLPQETVR
jgi:UDP-glucose 4-epimerase